MKVQEALISYLKERNNITFAIGEKQQQSFASWQQEGSTPTYPVSPSTICNHTSIISDDDIITFSRDISLLEDRMNVILYWQELRAICAQNVGGCFISWSSEVNRPGNISVGDNEINIKTLQILDVIFDSLVIFWAQVKDITGRMNEEPSYDVPACTPNISTQCCTMYYIPQHIHLHNEVKDHCIKFTSNFFSNLVSLNSSKPNQGWVISQ